MFCIHLCRNHLLWVFVAGILRKTQPWGIFVRVCTGKYIASCKQDDSLEDNYCASFFKLKYLIPALRHIFCSPKASKIHGECECESSVLWSKLEKYTFLWFKKRDFYFQWEENISEVFQKNMLKSYLVDIFFLRSFLL